MTRNQLPKWSTITREERFFTAILFLDLQSDPNPFWRFLSKQLPTEQDSSVVDIGYEVCFFRDAARAGLIERQPQLEKQTFDLTLTLSSQALVLVEAKAQQGYSTLQLDQLEEAKQRIIQSGLCPVHEVHLVAVCSSKYRPQPSTSQRFAAFVHWDEIARLYSQHATQYQRANQIYGD